MAFHAINRRQMLAATRCDAVWAPAFGPAAAAEVTIRQGYQTNIWGMPTYYLMKSGLLEKHGLKTEDFAVPSGNLTMQQMVARQVDLGTYAGPSFIIGHDKGGLVAIAQIETVGATGAMVVRKDLGITKMADLKGKKIANQTGSSIGNIFVDQVGPANGLKKGDFQEVRMDVNNMMAALSSKTVDAMINVEPYNAIAEAEGIGTIIMDVESTTRCRCSWRRRRLRREEPGRRGRVSEGLARRQEGLQGEPEEGVGRDLLVLHLEGLQHGPEDLRDGDGPGRGRSRASRPIWCRT